MKLDWEQIFAQGENDRIEFKKTLSGEKEIIETIGAFLNHKGGMIIIGYDEKKSEIIEPNIGQETLQNFINKVKIATNPQVIVDIYEAEYKGKRLLVIDVIEYPIKPVAVQGKYFRRRMNSNHILTPTEISSLHLFSLNSSWDYQLAQNATMKDIDMDTVKWFIQKLSQQKGKKITDAPMSVLGKYELTRENRPTFAALLLFPKEPSFILDVQIGLFEDEITIKKDRNIKKSVLFEVEEIMDFITAYITKEFIITGKPQREERWQYPLEAIREIAMNAVIHRDYQEGTHTQIKIFRDKISFWNSGKLPPDLTIEDIKIGAVQSKPRNRLLAQIFKELGIIEKYGAGVKRVIENFKAYGLAEPSFEEKSGGFYVVAPGGKLKKGTTQEITNNINGFGATTQETTQEIEATTQETTQEITDKIIQLIEENPKLSQRTIAELIGISDNGVKYHFKKLKREGRLTHIGPTKKGYWKIEK